MLALDREQVQHVAEESHQIRPGRDCGDRAGEDVIEHERGNGQFRHAAAHRTFDDLVHATTGEHRAALDIHGSHGIAEEHDGEDEPRRRFADRLFADAADVIGRGCQVAQHDGGRSPEADEGERHAGDDQHIGAGPRGLGWHLRDVEV